LQKGHGEAKGDAVDVVDKVFGTAERKASMGSGRVLFKSGDDHLRDRNVVTAYAATHDLVVVSDLRALIRGDE